jgi:ABC-type branched-subunit amino acid transport system ATPase component
MVTTFDVPKPLQPLSLADELAMRIHQSSQKRHVRAAAEARREAAAHDEAAAADAALLAEYVALADTAGLTLPRPADPG